MLRLSIAIPTYDRVAQLGATLQGLFAEPIPPEVEVVVIDNHSPVEIEGAIRGLPGIDFTRIRFLRNPANIGLAANILRCFEVAAAPWVWTLGDDDPPLNGAIQSILRQIDSAAPETALLKYNSANGGQVEKCQVIDGLDDFGKWCADFGFYSNFLFISSGVFRKEAVLSRLNVGYHWAYSLSPHVAILLDALRSGARIQLIPEEIVRHGREVSRIWSYTRLCLGFTTLGEVDGTDALAPTLAKIAQGYLGKQAWRRFVHAFVKDDIRSPRYWRSFYFRYAALFGGIRGWLLVQVTWIFYCVALVRLRFKRPVGRLGEAIKVEIQRS